MKVTIVNKGYKKFINNNLTKIIVIIVCILLLFTMILFNQNNELTHIEKVIQKNNRVNESIANPKYPTLSKPSNTQSTVINGDSIRISQKEIDSIDNYMRYWYEVLDTNSDGDIDNIKNK